MFRVTGLLGGIAALALIAGVCGDKALAQNLAQNLAQVCVEDQSGRVVCGRQVDPNRVDPNRVDPNRGGGPRYQQPAPQRSYGPPARDSGPPDGDDGPPPNRESEYGPPPRREYAPPPPPGWDQGGDFNRRNAGRPFRDDEPRYQPPARGPNGQWVCQRGFALQDGLCRPYVGR
jgi:hypothetical protein